VCKIERIQKLSHDAHDVLEPEAQAQREKFAQSAAAQVFHRQIGDPVVFAVVVDVDDARVSQTSRGQHLILEPGDDLYREIAVQPLLAHGFQGDRALGRRVDPLVDGPQRALADDFDDLVLAQLLKVCHKGLAGSVPRFRRFGNYSS
jgi:hypothetical protein